MKAISLWQPWATLWLLRDPDEKVFETRHWSTTHRGPLLIHAAKKRDGDVREALECGGYFESRLVRHGMSPAALAFSALIGIIDLIGCHRMRNIPEPGERESMAGHWAPERYAWERGPNVRIFDAPIHYRGSQRFFDVPSGVLEGGNLIEACK